MHNINWDSEISQLSGNRVYKLVCDYFNEYTNEVTEIMKTQCPLTIEDQIYHARVVGQLEVITKILNLSDTVKDILEVNRLKSEIEENLEDKEND